MGFLMFGFFLAGSTTADFFLQVVTQSFFLSVSSVFVSQVRLPQELRNLKLGGDFNMSLEGVTLPSKLETGLPGREKLSNYSVYNISKNKF